MTDKSRGWAQDDPRRRMDEAADEDVAAAERVAATDAAATPSGPPSAYQIGTTPPGVLNDPAADAARAADDARARAEAAEDASLDVDPLSECHAADPGFDAGARPDRRQAGRGRGGRG